MKIELTPRHEHFVREKVESGAYGSPAEVVREGLRLLEAEDQRTQRRGWLQAEVEKGFQGPATPWTASDGERIRRLVSRRAARVR
jgi:putative addiction module CopG family antidote